jgi:large-conductance mechanosensitive channel
MKFLIIALAIHFIGELISNIRKNINSNEAGEANKNVRHPAEYELR